MKIAFYGSSLLSSYWNGAATYYRGILRDLAGRGYDVTFYEPDAFDRQQHRDIDPPDWARSSSIPRPRRRCAACWPRRRDADVVVKASGVGVFDDVLLEGVIAQARAGALTHLLGRRRRRHAGRDARPTPAIRCAARCPSSTSCSPMAAARR